MDSSGGLNMLIEYNWAHTNQQDLLSYKKQVVQDLSFELKEGERKWKQKISYFIVLCWR